MEVRYKREMNHNYLIMKPEEQSDWGYECKMLVSNCIEGLLKFRIRQVDGMSLFYYEITSRQPLSRLLENRFIKSGEIRQILIHIALTLNRVEEYLLKEGQILLNPDYIYIDPETFTPNLCMMPGYESCFPDELTKLLQFFLEKVDHKDQESVVLAYSLYHESLKENYSMKDLLRFLTEKKWKQTNKNERPDYSHIGGKEEVREDVSTPEQNSLKKPTISLPKKTADMKEQDTKEKQDTRQIINNIACHIGIMAGAPILLWFLRGVNGLKEYGRYLAVGEAIFLAVSIAYQIFSLRNSKEKEVKREPITESRWKITPEYVADHTDYLGAPELLPEAEEELQEFQENEGAEEDTSLKTALLADFSGRVNEKEVQARLISLSEERENIKIPYTPFLIGKSEELADYRLNKSTVSRLHLRIDKSGDIYTITDLNSTNGTNIRGRQLETNETLTIEEGDIIYIADLGFQFSRK